MRVDARCVGVYTQPTQRQTSSVLSLQYSEKCTFSQWTIAAFSIPPRNVRAASGAKDAQKDSHPPTCATIIDYTANTKSDQSDPDPDTT